MQRDSKVEESEEPLIFEECFVKSKSGSRITSFSKLSANSELAQMVDPTGGISSASLGIFGDTEDENAVDLQVLERKHVFVLVHGYGGSQFDLQLVQKFIAYS